ncbi:MAG: hypothetical protein AMJ81_05290 [Phycisphaerae bacterium SM23_33]|jgi:tyrosyl-tRNA synthetase|nr:MAG: hypothetical protein AMJ81_05290 [Phycisphaerae bacterium SM23_33]
MNVRQQMELLLRGVEAAYSPAELEQRLVESEKTGKPLRVKYGMDPTAPDIHIGHAVPLRKLRQFQDLGHKAVLIIGDYTARVGDPSGQNVTRPLLSPEEIKTNARTYFDQAGKILDTSAARLEIRYNNEWLSQLKLADLLRLAGQITVARMMERDTFALRYRDNAPIGLHELLYPLMQAYDSVCVQADVELGGTDQTFNNLCGRDIQKAYGQKPQIVLILPILVGLDGNEKMSKSKGNYIGVTDEPNDMFGKVMSIPDELMENYFTLATELPAGEIKTLLDPKETHPRQAKATLAKTVVAIYHDEAAAEAAAAEFDRVFAERQVPTDMPEIPVPAVSTGIVELIVSAGFAGSNSEARRLIRQKAVSIDGQKITDVDTRLELRPGQVLRVGRRRFGKIALS